jgi:hypothetical protein
MKGIQGYTNKGPGHLQRGENCKNRVGSFKFIFSKNYMAKKAQIYIIASCKLDFIKIKVLRGQMGLQLGKNSFT